MGSGASAELFASFTVCRVSCHYCPHCYAKKRNNERKFYWYHFLKFCLSPLYMSQTFEPIYKNLWKQWFGLFRSFFQYRYPSWPPPMQTWLSLQHMIHLVNTTSNDSSTAPSTWNCAVWCGLFSYSVFHKYTPIRFYWPILHVSYLSLTIVIRITILVQAKMFCLKSVKKNHISK